MEKIIGGIWCVILIIQSVCDIRWRRIPIMVTAIGTGIGAIFCVLMSRNHMDILWAVLPGICCLIYSKCSDEALGYGDSFILCGLGLVFDIEEMLLLCMMAFGFAALAGGIIMVVLHKKKNYEMPFVPYLMVAYMIVMMLQNGGNDR